MTRQYLPFFCRDQVLEAALGAPQGRDADNHGFVADQGTQPLAGCFNLLLPQGRQGSSVIGSVAIDHLVNVAFRFGVADKNDAGRFHQAVGLGCK